MVVGVPVKEAGAVLLATLCISNSRSNRSCVVLQLEGIVNIRLKSEVGVVGEEVDNMVRFWLHTSVPSSVPSLGVTHALQSSPIVMFTDSITVKFS